MFQRSLPVYKTACCLLLALAVLMPVAGQEGGVSDGFLYRTKSGTRYHRDTCNSLKTSKIRVTWEEIQNTGLAPCTICKPPHSISETPKPVAEQAIYRVNLAGLSSYTTADISKMLHATVVRHVDGDTVRVHVENPPEGIKSEEVIRMIGVDTPETVHPKKSVAYFGKEASDWTKNALLGKQVYLALDWDTRDRYGRLLAYIYTAPGRCHNAELISNGYGYAYTRFPFRFLNEFRVLEQTARAAKRGLWADVS